MRDPRIYHVTFTDPTASNPQTIFTQRVVSDYKLTRRQLFQILTDPDRFHLSHQIQISKVRSDPLD